MEALTPNSVLAVDVAIMAVVQGRLQVLLQRRRRDPFDGMEALPGVLVLADETEGQAVERVLSAKVGAKGILLSQIKTFSEPGRDPRGRVAAVAWGGLVSASMADALASGRPGSRFAPLSPDGSAVVDPEGGPLSLAFDHGKMVASTVRWLRYKLRREVTGAEVLGEEFSLRDLQEVYEAVYGRELNASNFRSFALSNGLVTPTGRKAEATGRGRPGMLYRAAQRPATPWEA